jgi:hypothetical protein
MDNDAGTDDLSQGEAYRYLSSTLYAALAAALAQGSKRLLGAYLQSLLAYPDGCTRGETVMDPTTKEVLAQVPPLSEDRLYPKEQALVDLVAKERMQGRRVLVYVTHTATRDVTERLQDILQRHGFKAAVLKADTVPPDRREEWVAKRVAEGVDVLICHPRLVQTGLDLIEFPTIVWQEVEYSVYTMRQASRRSWRIGQTQPVSVVYMAYKGTLQADALTLVAKKLQSSLAVEGELPEDGLAAYGDDGDDLMLAMARRIVQGGQDGTGPGEDESLEEVFARARSAEAEAEELLVEAGWRPVEEPEEEREPALVSSAPAKEVATIERRSESLSWDEFLRMEPARRPRRTRKQEPVPALTLFEWAMGGSENGASPATEVPKQGEPEPVGVGQGGLPW